MINCKKCNRYIEVAKVKITHNKIEVCQECWNKIVEEITSDEPQGQ